MRAGALAVGLGAALTTGHGVAFADPVGGADTTQSSGSSPADSDTTSSGVVDSGEQAAAAQTPVETTSAETDDADGGPADGAPGDGTADADDAETAAEEPADDVAQDDGSQDLGAQPAAVVVASDAVDEASDPAPDEADSGTPGGTKSDAALTRTQGTTESIGVPARAATDKPDAATAASVSVAPTSEAKSTSTTVAATSTPHTAAVAVTNRAAAAPVTLASVVTDVLTWIGLGNLASYLPVPALPLPPILQAFWLVLRELHDGDTAQPATQIVATETTTDVEQVGMVDLLVRPGVSVSLNSDGTIDTIDGDFAGVAVTSADAAARVLNSLAELLGEPAGFATVDAVIVQQAGGVTAGDPNETFYRLQDSVGGISVEGSDVILVTDAAGVVTGLFNNHIAGLATLDTRLNASIDASYEAAAIATVAYLKAMGRTAFFWDVWAFEARSAINSRLVIAPTTESSTPQLLWRVMVAPTATLFSPAQPSATYYIYANGSAAADIMRVSSAAHALTSISVIAKDELGQNRTINVAKTVFLFFFESLQMQDMTRNISTYNTTYGFLNFGAPTISSSPTSKDWLFGWNAEAVSAQANTAIAHDYYLNVFGLNSYDGKGGTLGVVVNYNPVNPWAGPYNNAFWDPGAKVLAFGDGADLEVAIDVIGHEYTHAVVTYIFGGNGVGLDYGESGALNEAYADVIGSLIEGKVDAGLWLIGEDSKYPGGAVRNIANPTATAGGYRDNYKNLYTGTGDEGGEHVNSTIFSHAVYEMMTSTATAGVSGQTWAKVFYHSLYRLSSSAKFSDARVAVLDTAKKEFGFSTAQLGAISGAFDSVGIVAPAQTVAV